MEEFDTPYVVVAVRTLADPRDGDDMAVAEAVQDGLRIRATAAGPFESPRYDVVGLDRTRSALLALCRSITAARNDDGTVTVLFGGDGDPARNSLSLTEGWNYLVRLYRPRPEILDRTWTFPRLKT